ncbi:MAG TPA: hypothetical protein EYO01_06520 [Phycisphaerales bacterium]|nr:hypothetical protein [Phycisphaerales bacterium]
MEFRCECVSIKEYTFIKTGEKNTQGELFMNVQRITSHVAMIAAFSLLVPAVADFDFGNSQKLDRAINTALQLEHSWHTTLHINSTPERSIRIDIPIENKIYTLELEPHSVRSDTYSLFMQDDEGELYEVPAGPIRTLRGTIVGVEGSVVAGSLMEDGLHARIRFSDDLEYWMEPVGLKINRAPENLYAFYRNADIIPSGGICAAEDRVDVGQILSMQANFVVNEKSRGGGGGGTICTADLGVDADWEYFQAWGGQTESQINSVINSVNVQYEGSVNLTHAISSIIVRSSSNDPYTSSDAGTLLDQFRSEWQNNQGGIPHDIAHLFTGRSMQGSTIGIAWLSSVCSSVKYGLAESDCCGSFGCSTDLTAHELGHGWGAGHCDCTSFTMNPWITCSNQFTNGTISAINSFAGSLNCLTCGPVDPVGACCVGSQCVEVTEANCSSGGGIYQSDNSACGEVSCVAPTGACCIDFECSIAEEVACISAGGAYQGDETGCNGLTCAAPTGACCVDGSCSVTTQSECANSGGTYEGDATNCSTVGCAFGACCVGIDCSQTLFADCSGNWYGDNTVCADTGCGTTADQLNYELRSWSRSDGQSMETYDLYFPSVDPNTRMVSVFGENADLLQVRAWTNADFDGTAALVSMHQSQFGADGPHDRILDAPFGIDLVFDSYVTIGSTDAATGEPLLLGFDSAGFNSAAGIEMNNGIWFVIPDDPMASLGAGTALGHRLVSLSVESGQGIEMLTNIQWFDGADVVHENRNLYWNNLGLGGGPACPTDLNNDGSTDVTDVLTMIGQWGACAGCSGDINGDDVVDVSDLLELIAAWGPC